MIRGGVVGFGRMGVTHYALLNTHPEVQMVAVCDANSFAMSNLKRFSPAEVYSDYRKMIDQADLDFVIVATPTASHAEICERAIEKGLHVFVEKPFVLGAEVGLRLVERAESAGIVNQVGYFLRFNEMFELVREYLRDGLIGRVVHYRSEMYGRAVLQAAKSSWRGNKREGGGCMLDFASHCIDLADHLFGSPKTVGGSLLKKVYSGQVEDAVYTTLTYDNGLSGNIMVNWSDESFRRPYNRIEIFGTAGKIVADRQECRLYLRQPDEHGRFRKGWTITYLPDVVTNVRFDIRGAEFTNQLDHFVDCILRSGAESRCDFAAALRTDGVIEAIETDHRERMA